MNAPRMYVCMYIHMYACICMYVCMQNEKISLQKFVYFLPFFSIMSLYVCRHLVTQILLTFSQLCTKYPCLSPWQFMHQLCCTGIKCLSFLKLVLLFRYLPTTLNTLILVLRALSNITAFVTFSQVTLHLLRVKVAAAAAVRL